MLGFDSPLERSETPNPLTPPLANSFDPRDYLETFEARYPKELELFRVVGIHPDGSHPLLNPYTGTLCHEDFSNIGEHCIAVAYCSQKISQGLLESGVIDQTQFDQIVRRALVHDLAKPYEIMRRDAAHGGVVPEVYTHRAYAELKDLLLAQGISVEIADYVTNSGSETSHNSLLELIVCNDLGFQALIPGRLLEKIVFLADDMTFTSIPKANERPLTYFLTFPERMLASRFAERYPFLWSEGVAIDDKGGLVPIRDVTQLEPGQRLIACYADLEEKVSYAICSELKSLLDCNSPFVADQFVKNLVNAT